MKEGGTKGPLSFQKCGRFYKGMLIYDAFDSMLKNFLLMSSAGEKVCE